VWRIGVLVKDGGSTELQGEVADVNVGRGAFMCPPLRCIKTSNRMGSWVGGRSSAGA